MAKRTTSLEQAAKIEARKRANLEKAQRNLARAYNDWKQAQRTVDRWIRKITDKALEGYHDG